MHGKLRHVCATLRASVAAALLLAALASTISAKAKDAQTDSTSINATAQDSTGIVWGASRQGGGLYRWSGGHWTRASGRMPSGAYPAGIWNGPDGGVVVVWGGLLPAVTLTWYRGSESKELGNLGFTFNGQVFVTPPDNVWLTSNNSPDISRLSDDGHLQTVYTFQPGQFFAYRHPPGQPTLYCPFEVTADGQGRAWIWANSAAQFSNWAPLQGFLIYNGRSFEYHRTIADLPDHGITLLGPKDRTHLWAGVLRAGLYSIDTETVTAQPAPEPEPGAFDYVTKVFSAGADTYALTEPATQAVAETPAHRFTGILWRLENGRWSKALDGVDDVPSRPEDLVRPWLNTPDGLWFGSRAAGLWFIPSRGGSPTLVNWRQGFPLDTVDRLYRLAGGKLLAVELHPGMTVAVHAASLLKPRKAAENVRVINPYSGLETDQKFHLWGILSIGGRALNEWDGEKWTAHPLPGNLTPTWLSGADADSAGRIWLFPGCQMGPIAVLDPRDGVWTPYPSYQEALDKTRSHPVRFLNASDDKMKPVYGPDGQMAYTGACSGINYFDGTQWRLWNRPDVPAGLPYFFDGPAFFDTTGNLAVDIHHETFEFGKQTGWRPTAYQASTGRLFRWMAPAPPGSPPTGCSFTQSNGIARDRLGRSWWAWEGNVYVGVPGRCRVVLSADEPQPFIDGRRLRRVLIDSQGGVFFETLAQVGNLGEYVVLPPSDKHPQVSIKLQQLAPDSFRAELSATEKALFTWRVDGNDWSPPQQQDYVLFRSLAAGSHVIEADAIDDRVEMAPIPASVKVDIGGNEQEMIASLVSRLLHESSDNGRETDIEALAQQPAAETLPALEAAQPTAKAAVRWWIDAAIQQAEDKLAKGSER